MLGLSPDIAALVGLYLLGSVYWAGLWSVRLAARRGFEGLRDQETLDRPKILLALTPVWLIAALWCGLFGAAAFDGLAQGKARG